MRYVIFGTGGFAREIVTLVRAAADNAVLDEANKHTPHVCFAADQPELDRLMGLPVISANAITPDDIVVIAIGDGAVRREIEQRIPGRFGSVKADTAMIGPDTSIGDGAVMCDFSMITASAKIGRQFQCNIYSYVAHDCVIGDYVTFAPRVCCNGNVHIGDGAYIGTGAVIKQGTAAKPLRIGAGAIVGMGAVVTKDVPPGAIVVGNPAVAR
jgi:sugar O-acyltransferase (sialic acid O-acetyltransferase NeuD family)